MMPVHLLSIPLQMAAGSVTGGVVGLAYFASLFAKETLINGPTSEVAGEMASNFLDDEANRRSIQ